MLNQFGQTKTITARTSAVVKEETLISHELEN
jgi:hypothetical protein